MSTRGGEGGAAQRFGEGFRGDAPPKRLIVTADDFGLDPAVNEAVEQAHRDGILTSASLMIGAAAAEDAVARARRLPGLRVGLHLTLSDARPVSPIKDVSRLVAADGRFVGGPVEAGLRYALRPGVRRELAGEIRAQFAAFAKAGLPLDHLNAHQHLHLHPVIGRLVIEIGREFGLHALRLPWEPRHVIARAEPGASPGLVAAAVIHPWLSLLRRRVRRAGLLACDQVFGLTWSGAMTEARWRALLPHLPDGLTEIYCHPAADSFVAPQPVPGYRYIEELAALLGPEIRRDLHRYGILLTSYGKVVGNRGTGPDAGGGKQTR